MWAKSIRIKNYKSITDSKTLDLGSDFNFLLGKNNSGKTAIIEAFNLNHISDNRHRDLNIPKDAASTDRVTIEICVKVEPDELFNAATQSSEIVNIPISSRENQMAEQVWKKAFCDDGLEIYINYSANAGYTAPWPSHGMFPSSSQQINAAYRLKSTNRKMILEGFGQSSDSLPAIFDGILREKIFIFKAERFSSANCPINADVKLKQDASNLPRALFEMQRNSSLWQRFNQHVNEIIPSVSEVNIFSPPGTTSIHMEIWPVPSSTGRTDLVTKLDNCGTGVGQVLSILCACLTYDRAIICIDEPNNYLHPGAVKALMRVLSQYKHQYLMASHSPFALSLERVSSAYHLSWKDCITSVRRIDVSSVDESATLIADLGLSAADVFGFDSIVWVEGQTEEICFPLIAQSIFGRVPTDWAFVRVRSVDEIVKRKGVESTILDIYQRLSRVGGLLGSKARFIFDREGRDDGKIEDIRRQTDGMVHFLERRCYENYLLDAKAIEKVMRDEALTTGSSAPTEAQIEEFIDLTRKTLKGGSEGDWKVRIDAPELLRLLFQEKINVEYRKTKHSPDITREILARGGQELAGVAAFLSRIMQ